MKNLVIILAMSLMTSMSFAQTEKTDLEVIQQIKDGLTRVDKDVDKYEASLPYFFACVSLYQEIWTYQTKFRVEKEGKKYEVILSENLDPEDWAFEIRIIMTSEIAQKYGEKRFIYLYLDAEGNHLGKIYQHTTKKPNNLTPQAALEMIGYLENLPK